MVEIKFSTSNAAFCDPFTLEPTNISIGQETVSILYKIISDIEAGRVMGSCIDANGNKVGSWTIKKEV